MLTELAGATRHSFEELLQEQSSSDSFWEPWGTSTQNHPPAEVSKLEKREASLSDARESQINFISSARVLATWAASD